MLICASVVSLRLMHTDINRIIIITRLCRCYMS